MPEVSPAAPSASIASSPASFPVSGGASTAAADKRSLSLVLHHIEAHLGEPLPLESLAALCGLSVWRFATVFRQRVGTSPHRYVSEQRVQRAQALLRQGVPPARAASEAGFYDQSHMNRRLKRLTGQSAREARLAVGVTCPAA